MAAQALAWIAKLNAIEAGIKDKSPGHKLAVRQAEAVPLLAQFHQWLQGNAHGLLTRQPLAQAFGYALRHWQALVRYTESGVTVR